MRSLSIQVDGMSCGHCVAAVRGALEAIPGVVVEKVEVGSARVGYDPATTSPERVAHAIRDEGYTPTSLEG